MRKKPTKGKRIGNKKTESPVLAAWDMKAKCKAMGLDVEGALDKAFGRKSVPAKIPKLHRTTSEGLPHVTHGELTGKSSEEVSDYLYFEVLDAAGLYRGEWSDFAAAVHKLPQHWRLIYTVCWLNAEVDNGGHEQFFDNGCGEFDTEADLRFIGADKFLELYLEARKLFYNHTVVKKERSQEVEPLDDAFYEQEKSLYVLVGEYVLSHLSDYCVD